MTIHSLYIYDRCDPIKLYPSDMCSCRPPPSHCNCVYYQDWNRSRRPKPAVEGGGILPGVSRAVAPTIGTAAGNREASRDSFAPNSGVVIAVNDEHANGPDMQGAPQPGQTSTGLPFDEEAKLVYGVVLSLRNMARKLSGRSACFLRKIIHLNSCHAAAAIGKMNCSLIIGHQRISCTSTKPNLAINSSCSEIQQEIRSVSSFAKST